MKEVPLKNSNKVALIDDEDFERLCKYEWTLQRDGYAKVYFSGKWVSMHTLLCLTNQGEEVDHKNRVRLDNRKSNLRACTRLQNNANRGLQRNNTSGYKGVVYSEHICAWRAQIYFKGRRVSLGSFPTKEEAYEAYCKRAKRLFGEFANVANE